MGTEVRMSIIAWIILGAIAGYLAGFLVKGDEGLGVIGHIVLGIVGALRRRLPGQRPVQQQADRRPVRHQLDRRRDHRRDHHGRRGRHGHQQHPDGPRLDLTRGPVAGQSPGTHFQPNAHRLPVGVRVPGAGRWPADRASPGRGSPWGCNATAASGGRSRDPRAPTLVQSAPVPLGVRGPTFRPAGQTVMHLQGGRQEPGVEDASAGTLHSPPRHRIDQPGPPVTGAPRFSRTTRAPSPGRPSPFLARPTVNEREGAAP